MYLQNVTYWKAAGFGPEGEIYSTPATFKGRWEDRNELFLNPRGEEVVSDSIVFCPKSSPVVVNGYLYLGISIVPDPRNQEGARQIRAVVSVPDLRIIAAEQRAML